MLRRNKKDVDSRFIKNKVILSFFVSLLICPLSVHLSLVWLATQNQSALLSDTTTVPFLPVNPSFSSTRNQVGNPLQLLLYDYY